MRDQDLQYFKDILLSRKAQILKNLSAIEQEYNAMLGMDLNDDGDFASVSSDNMVDSAISAQQSKELSEIEESLVKIKNKQYGICDMCEDEIGIQRLKVKPHAKYCIVCRPIVEKSK